MYMILARGFGAAEFCVFLVGTTVLAVIDARTMQLPSRVLYPVSWSGLALLACSAAFSGSWARLFVALCSAALLVAAFFPLHKTSGLGRGDVRLAGLLGLFLGWFGVATVIVGVALGTVLAGVFGAVALARRADRPRMLPYGPFLILGAWLALLRATGTLP